MKLETLNLLAFGPFTERVLSFDAPGLHIVYGPNEAGKSSSLRALKALFYGIDNRSRDNFIHANNKLRVGATISNAGKRLEFVRRKGNKNTLLSMDEQPLDNQALAPFLNGVSLEVFETLFAIDHQSLLKGGQQILAQQGEVGQALFSAALGGHALRSVLDQLDSEAKELFLASASDPKINANLKKLKELNRQIKECSLSSKKWQDAQQLLTKTAQELAAAQQELSASRLGLNRLKRAQRVLPKFARRTLLLEQLNTMKEVVELKPDFSNRHQKVIQKLALAEGMLNEKKPRYAQLETQLNALVINDEVLRNAGQINDLYTGLGGYRQALTDQPELRASYQLLQTESEHLLKEMGVYSKLNDIETLRPMLLKKTAASDLGSQKKLLISQRDRLDKELADADQKMKAALTQANSIPNIGNIDFLTRAIAAARKEGNVDLRIEEQQAECSNLQQWSKDALSRLTLWSGELTDVLGLATPSKENIQYFEDKYAQFKQQTNRNIETKHSLEQEILTLKVREEAIHRQGSVPSEKDLQSARAYRNTLWHILRRQWVGAEDVSSEVAQLKLQASLPASFDKELITADEVSDRLRRESGRVATLAALQGELSSVQAQLEIAISKEKQFSTLQVQLDAQWKSLWVICQVQPGTPREMRAWLEVFEQLRSKVEQLQKTQQLLSLAGEGRLRHLEKVIKLLRDFSQPDASLGFVANAIKELNDTNSLEWMLASCEAVANQLSNIKKQQEDAEKQIQQLTQEQNTLNTNYTAACGKLDDWQQQWDELLKQFGIKNKAMPDEINQRIELLRTLFDNKRQIDNLDLRLVTIQQSISNFSDKTLRLRETMIPNTTAEAPDQLVTELQQLLSYNRAEKEKYQQVSQQLKELTQEISVSELATKQSHIELDKLCVEADVTTPKELHNALIKDALLRETRSHIEQNISDILDAGEGADMVTLEKEAGQYDPDQLAENIERLTQDIEQNMEPSVAELA